MSQVEGNSCVAHYRKTDGTPQSGEEHLRGVSELAAVFAGKIGIATLGKVAGLLHDLGKFSAAFQAYIAHPDSGGQDAESCATRPRRGEIDHSTAGAQFCWRPEPASYSLARHLAQQILALCLASHHSGLIDCLSPDGGDIFSKRMAKTIEPTLLTEVEIAIRQRATDLLDSTCIESEITEQLEAVKRSGTAQAIAPFMLGLLTRFLFSALIDADRLNTADFENRVSLEERLSRTYPSWTLLIQKLEAHLGTFEVGSIVDELRREVSEACLEAAKRDKGFYQLTVPTGGGKTLASLRFALNHAEHHGMERVIYVAPYTSIIDQNAGVARSVFEPADTGQIVLEHHSNLTTELDTWQNRVLSENWDAPIVFTTAVQLLEALFGSGTRGARRMHQLANAVIILDEPQAIPIKTTHLVNNALNFLVGLCGSTVVLCTATQPLLDKVDAGRGAAKLSENSELMPDVQRLFQTLRRVEVVDKRKAGGWTEEEVAATALSEMRRTGSTLVVVNTKAQARQLFRLCQGRTEHVYHLSTSMCPAHRMDCLNRIKACLDPANPSPVICISTQLIEAGVDVDFGSAIRYLAGLDSIAQVAGRCNRNARRPTGSVLIVNLAGEGLDKLPEIRTAQAIAVRVLDEFRGNPAAFDEDLQSPAAMSRYYQYYFFERAQEMAYAVSPGEVGRNDTLLSLLSTNELSVEAYKRVHKAPPPLYLRQSFKTAAAVFEVIDAPTQGVIVPYSDEGDRVITALAAADGLQRQAELLRQAQRYSVSMYPHEIRQLRETGSLREVREGSDILYLDECHYSPEFGASVDRVGEMKVQTT